MDRDTLRIILAVAGVILIAGIYFFETWRKKRRLGRRVPFMLDPRNEQAPASGFSEGGAAFDDLPGGPPPTGAPRPPAQSPEPALDGLPRDFHVHDDAPPLHPPAEMPALRAREHAAPAAAPGNELLVVFNVMANEGQRMHGARLLPVFERFGLQLGADGMFHAPVAADGRSRYRVLNTVKPGVFTAEGMSDLWIPGIALFAPVPPGTDPVLTFDALLAEARALADELEGRVCDDRRNQLTAQSENHLREQLREQARRQRIAT